MTIRWNNFSMKTPGKLLHTCSSGHLMLVLLIWFIVDSGQYYHQQPHKTTHSVQWRIMGNVTPQKTK